MAGCTPCRNLFPLSSYRDEDACGRFQNGDRRWLRPLHPCNKERSMPPQTWTVGNRVDAFSNGGYVYSSFSISTTFIPSSSKHMLQIGVRVCSDHELSNHTKGSKLNKEVSFFSSWWEGTIVEIDKANKTNIKIRYPGLKTSLIFYCEVVSIDVCQWMNL